MTALSYETRKLNGEQINVDLKTSVGSRIARATIKEVLGLGDAFEIVWGTYARYPSFYIQSGGVSIYTVGFLLSEVNGSRINVKGHLSDLDETLPFDWTDNSFKQTEEGTTLRWNLKEIFRQALEALKPKLQTPTTPGCVKAFFQLDEVFWVNKRATSANLIAYDGKHYLKDVCFQFQRVHRTEEDFDYVPERELITSNVTTYGDGYWYTDSLVPVYVNAVPFDTISHRCPQDEAERLYEQVVVSGEVRYINREKPGMSFFQTGVHSYQTRVESLLDNDKLFLMGSSDLYAKRDRAEVPFLGWELEACCNLSKVGRDKTARTFKEQLPFLVFCKNDGSISPEGFETVSVPATLDAWKETELAAALDVMRVAPYSMRSYEHSSTGFHVHVSRSALSVLDLQKLERFMHNPANRTMLTDIAGRGATSYQKYDDKLFSNRNRPIVEVSGDSRRGECDNLLWLSGGVSTALSRLNSYFPGARGFYDWCNAYISFADSGRRVQNHPDTIHFASIFLSGTGSYPTFDMVAHVLRDDRASHYTESTKEAAKSIIIAVAQWGPSINQAIRYFFPDYDIPEITAVPDEPVEEVKKFKFGELVRKTRLPVGRKSSYAAALASPGPCGKGAQRYDVLNTKNPSTVEFRLFKGTMNPVSVFRYLEFVDAIVRFVPSTSAKDEGLHYPKFLEWLVGDSFNVARYEHLVSFLTEKGYIERKVIKRKELVKIVKGDGENKEGLVVKRFKPENVVREPLYVLTVREDAANAPATATPEEINRIGIPFSALYPRPSSGSLIPDYDEEEPDYDVEEETDYEEPEECDCDDCRRGRGEIE